MEWFRNIIDLPRCKIEQWSLGFSKRAHAFVGLRVVLLTTCTGARRVAAELVAYGNSAGRCRRAGCLKLFLAR